MKSLNIGSAAAGSPDAANSCNNFIQHIADPRYANTRHAHANDDTNRGDYVHSRCFSKNAKVTV